MCKLNKWLLIPLSFCLAAIRLTAAESQSLGTTGATPGVSLTNSNAGPWDGGIGEGFLSSAQTISIDVGAVKGVQVLGGRQTHDLALLSLSYGHMLSHTVGEGHFYRGNWELRFELFGGSQFSPGSDWVIGLTPHLRYDFATGTRFIPFIDFGAGVTATSISAPDLSNTFEFNLQANGGVQWFLQDDLAITLRAGYLHMSCAHLSSPNLGLNGIQAMLGLSFLF
jgi:hypothetical protein